MSPNDQWRPEGPLSPERIEELRATGAIQISDTTPRQVEELFKVRNPSVRPSMPEYFERLEQFKSENPGREQWWFYPWRQQVVHLLAPELHQELRTARNRNLITAEEQGKLAAASIGIAGLSVGSSVATALSMLGPYKLLKLADGDTLDLTNLNRIFGSVTDLGLNKTVKTARQITELDPTSAIELYPQGISEDDIENFLDRLSVVVDAMDNLRLKTMLRLAARERGIPVVMATDAGNNSIIDIERFDWDREQPIFHGRLSEAEVEMLLGEHPDPARWAQLSLKIIGIEHIESRMIEVAKEFQAGKLAGIPQIGPSAMQGGAIAAFAVREVILGGKLKRGKVAVDIVKHLIEETAALPAEQGDETA